MEQIVQENGTAPDTAAIQEQLLTKIGHQLQAFPGYATVRQVTVIDEPWTVENSLITPTLKPRRTHIMKRYSDEIEAMYAGH